VSCVVHWIYGKMAGAGLAPRLQWGKRVLAKSCAYLLLGLLAAASPTVHALLPIHSWQTSTGARVLFVENHDLPMLDVSVEFPAGSGYDSAQTSGRAALTQQVRRLGAGGLSEDAIADRIADVGAQLGGRFDADRAGSHLRTLSSARERDQALDVLALVLQRPEFPPKVLEREKARMIASLKEADTKPDTLASRAFHRMVYREHPYGLRGAGEVETLANLTRADLLEFFRTHYVADNAVVAIMGDVNRAQAERIAEHLTQGLPRARGEVPSIPAVSVLERANSAVVAHPALQAHILIGAPGIGRDDPDYYSLYVGNHILGGGGFASRLNEEVRQKRGLAYSVYSYFVPWKRGGAFQIGLQTQGQQAQTARKVVIDVLSAFLEHGPSTQELAEAKSNIIGGFPLRLDSNREIHEYLALIGFYRLPLTYLEDFVKNVEKVTVADVRAAFSRHVHIERLVTVMVGGGPVATK
jgi:zinc protease